MCGFVFEIFYSQQIEVDSEKLLAASRKIRSEMSGRANDKLIFFKSHGRQTLYPGAYAS